LCEFELEEQREATGSVAAPKWSSEMAGGELTGRRNTAHGVRPNHDETKIFKMLRWFTSSPRCCRDGRQGCRRSDGDTMVDGIGGLVEKMRSMPMIQSTPDQFL
jgi:hypothetical protein